MANFASGRVSVSGLLALVKRSRNKDLRDAYKRALAYSPLQGNRRARLGLWDTANARRQRDNHFLISEGLSNPKDRKKYLPLLRGKLLAEGNNNNRTRQLREQFKRSSRLGVKLQDHNFAAGRLSKAGLRHLLRTQRQKAVNRETIAAEVLDKLGMQSMKRSKLNIWNTNQNHLDQARAMLAGAKTSKDRRHYRFLVNLLRRREQVSEAGLKTTARDAYKQFVLGKPLSDINPSFQDHHFVTASDVHVDTALHIPKRNRKRRLKQAPIRYNGSMSTPVSTSKVSTPMTLPNQGKMRPADSTRGFAEVEHIEGFAKDDSAEFALGALAGAGKTLGGFLKKKKLAKTIRKNPFKAAGVAAGVGAGAGYLASGDEDFDEEDFAAGRVSAKRLSKTYKKLFRKRAARGEVRNYPKHERDIKQVSSELNPRQRRSALRGRRQAAKIRQGDRDFQGSTGMGMQRRSSGMRSASMARSRATNAAMSGMRSNFAGGKFRALKEAAKRVKDRSGTSYKNIRKRGGRALLATGVVGGAAGVGAGTYGYKRIAN